MLMHEKLMAGQFFDLKTGEFSGKKGFKFYKKQKLRDLYFK